MNWYSNIDDDLFAEIDKWSDINDTSFNKTKNWKDTTKNLTKVLQNRDYRVKRSIYLGHFYLYK